MPSLLLTTMLAASVGQYGSYYPGNPSFLWPAPSYYQYRPNYPQWPYGFAQPYSQPSAPGVAADSQWKNLAPLGKGAIFLPPGFPPPPGYVGPYTSCKEDQIFRRQGSHVWVPEGSAPPPDAVPGGRIGYGPFGPNRPDVTVTQPFFFPSPRGN